MPQKSTNGRWVHADGGANSPAFRTFGLLVLVVDVVVGIASFAVGAVVNGSLMILLALFVILTLWDDIRERR